MAQFLALVGWLQLEADESELSAVRRPGRHVDGALAAEEFCQHTDFFITLGHDAQHDVFIFRMAGDFFSVAKKNHLLAVG